MSGVPRKVGRTIAVALLEVALSLSFARSGNGQTTVGTGSIVGIVSDPAGAVVAGAQIAITNTATGQVIALTTNSFGSFNSGALIPGDYTTLVSAKGFRSAEALVTVFVGNIATANVNLQIGQENQVVKVQGSEMRVNTEQPTVQGVLTTQQIKNLRASGIIGSAY